MKHANKKPRGTPRRALSIDGIISSNPHLGKSYDRDELQQLANPNLGTLNTQADGFHPMRAGTSALGDLPASEPSEEELDEPVLLEHPKPKKPPKFRKHPKTGKVFKRTGLFLVALILIGATYFGFKLYNSAKHFLAGGGQAPAVCDGDVPLSTLKTEGDGRVNVLLLGIGGEEHVDGPYATDTIIVASIDPVNDKMDLLSIPRDLYVRIPGNGSTKINAAYLYGRDGTTSKNEIEKQKNGISVVDKTLESILGVSIHYHALVSFEAFRQSVDAMGGVDINVPKDLAVRENLWDEGTGKHYQLDVKAGPQHFDGTKALFFARSRVTSARGDFDRSARQRLMLIAIKDKALSIGTLTNPVRMSSLLDSLGSNVYTDFDSGSLKCLSKQISQIQSTNITSLDLVTPPHDLLYSSGLAGSTQSPKAGVYNFSQIQNFVRSSFRDSFLAKENSAVAVYNATTTAGLAKTKADELKAYGYNVTVVDSAPNAANPTTTTVVDLTAGKDKYTRHYLETRFKVTAVSNLPNNLGISPPTGTRFVIILGKDATTQATH